MGIVEGGRKRGRVREAGSVVEKTGNAYSHVPFPFCSVNCPFLLRHRAMKQWPFLLLLESASTLASKSLPLGCALPRVRPLACRWYGPACARSACPGPPHSHGTFPLVCTQHTCFQAHTRTHPAWHRMLHSGALYTIAVDMVLSALSEL